MSFLKEEGIDQVYAKLWIRTGGNKKKIPSTWITKPIVDMLALAGDNTSEWEVATPKAKYPRPRDWRKQMETAGIPRPWY